jgi:hypothetical protein
MRPAHSRTPKRDLVPVVEELTVRFGLGERMIAKLLGYSQRYIGNIKHEFGIPTLPRGDRSSEVIRQLLPETIKLKCDAIYARSKVTAVERRDEKFPQVSARLVAHSVRAMGED